MHDSFIFKDVHENLILNISHTECITIFENNWITTLHNPPHWPFELSMILPMKRLPQRSSKLDENGFITRYKRQHAMSVCLHVISWLAAICLAYDQT